MNIPGKRIFALLGPLALYLLIGLLSQAGAGSTYSVRENLIEKSVCAAAMAYFYRKNSLLTGRKEKPLSAKRILLLLLTGGAFCICLNEFFALTGIFRSMAQDYSLVTESLYTGQLAEETILMILAAPAAEELLFRGILFEQIRERRSFLFAAVISSLIFAAFHGNILQGIYGLLFGLTACLICEKTGNILSAFLLHAAANAVSLAVSEAEGISSFFAAFPIILSAAGGLLFAAGIFLIMKSCRKDFSKDTAILKQI